MGVAVAVGVDGLDVDHPAGDRRAVRGVRRAVRAADGALRRGRGVAVRSGAAPRDGAARSGGAAVGGAPPSVPHQASADGEEGGPAGDTHPIVAAALDPHVT